MTGRSTQKLMTGRIPYIQNPISEIYNVPLLHQQNKLRPLT